MNIIESNFFLMVSREVYSPSAIIYNNMDITDPCVHAVAGAVFYSVLSISECISMNMSTGHSTPNHPAIFAVSRCACHLGLSIIPTVWALVLDSRRCYHYSMNIHIYLVERNYTY